MEQSSSLENTNAEIDYEEAVNKLLFFATEPKSAEEGLRFALRVRASFNQAPPDRSLQFGILFTRISGIVGRERLREILDEEQANKDQKIKIGQAA